MNHWLEQSHCYLVWPKWHLHSSSLSAYHLPSALSGSPGQLCLSVRYCASHPLPIRIAVLSGDISTGATGRRGQLAVYTDALGRR